MLLRDRARSAAVAAAAATLVVSPAASAQGLALDRFEPAPADDRMFGVPSPSVNGHAVLHVATMIDYAHDPLVFRRTTDDSGVGSVVSNQLLFHANATFALWNRLALNLDMPVALAQSGDDVELGGHSYEAPKGTQLGDLRTGARVRVFGEPDDAFQIGLGGYVWIPTAPSDGYVGTGHVRGMSQLLLGGRGDRFVWSFAAGPKFQATQVFAGTTQGTEIDVGAGIGVLLLDKHLQLGPEAYAAFTVASSDKSPNDALERASNIEVLADARYRFSADGEIGLGVGPGLTGGLGTPDLRGVLMAAFTLDPKKPAPPPHDGEGDSVAER